MSSVYWRKSVSCAGDGGGSRSVGKKGASSRSMLVNGTASASAVESGAGGAPTPGMPPRG